MNRSNTSASSIALTLEAYSSKALLKLAASRRAGCKSSGRSTRSYV